MAGLSLAYAMAVDWLAGNLYILDSELRRMVVCAISTSICSSIHIHSAGSFSSIALNPHEGQVFVKTVRCKSAIKATMTILLV